MNEPIRVLQVFGIMNRGGAENMIMNFYRAIDRNKIQFDFVVHTEQIGSFDEEIKVLGGKIFHAPSYKGINHFSYVKWWKTFFEEHRKYKIIHCHIRSTASIILSIASKSGLMTIAHSHSTSNGRGVRSVAKRALQQRIEKWADYCFACSREAGKWLFPHKEFTVLFNSIDIAKFTFCPKSRIEARKEFGVPDDCLVVGTVGRLSTPKNPYGIIDIIKAVVKKEPSAKLLWVGDGEMRQEIEERIKQENLESSVIMTGVRSDVNRLVQAMDVFIFPSLWEGLPVSLIEAQAAGLSCLCSDAVPREVAVTDLCTFLPLPKPELWADRVLHAETARKDVTQQIRDAGYDIATTSQWLEKFYCSCLSG